MGDPMRSAVDAELCTGHGRCYTVAPAVFTADDDGYCTQRGTEFDVPEALEQPARAAALNCPERAIHLSDKGA